MTKNKKAKADETAAVKTDIDAESAAVDTGVEGQGAAETQAVEIPAGLNPGSGGDYRLEDGKHIRVK